MFSPNKKIYLLVANHLSNIKEKDWLSAIPELGIIANVEPVFVFRKSSVDITPEIWIRLAKEIYERSDKAAGFVVLHGLDNLLYTSAAISFLLQNLTKPIIFTGSQGLPDIRKMEARANLINASQFATCGINEVALMVGSRLLRANQTVRAIDDVVNMFNTPADAILGRIDFSVRIFEKAITKNKGKVKFFEKLSSKVEIIEATPIINLKNLAERVSGKEGIIIDASKFQDLPSDLLFFLEKIIPNIPVIVWSRQIKNQILAPNNVMLINNLTWEATATKFMWVLGQTNNHKQIQALMNKDIAGETIE